MNNKLKDNWEINDVFHQIFTLVNRPNMLQVMTSLGLVYFSFSKNRLIFFVEKAATVSLNKGHLHTLQD